MYQFMKYCQKTVETYQPPLTDGIFETGAYYYGAPSISQNPTVLGQGGLSNT